MIIFVSNGNLTCHNQPILSLYNTCIQTNHTFYECTIFPPLSCLVLSCLFLHYHHRTIITITNTTTIITTTTPSSLPSNRVVPLTSTVLGSLPKEQFSSSSVRAKYLQHLNPHNNNNNATAATTATTTATTNQTATTTPASAITTTTQSNHQHHHQHHHQQQHQHRQIII